MAGGPGLSETARFAHHALARSQWRSGHLGRYVAAALGGAGNAREPLVAEPNTAKGALPRSRPQGVSPGFRASLVQPSAALRPFHSRYRFVTRVGDPPPLAVATPRSSPGGVRYLFFKYR